MKTTPIQTFEELMKGRKWKAVLRLLKKKNATIRVAESEIMMGRYAAVILNGRGFQCESGRGGMSAAFAGNNPTFKPIKSAKDVLEKAIDYSGPLSDDPPGTPTPSENELVGKILLELEKNRQRK